MFAAIPLHPALVHLPMGLSVVLPLVAIAVALALWRGKLGRPSWWVVVGLQAMLVGGAFVALNTGERDEERVEAVVPEAAIEAHEDAAKQFTLGAVLTLVLAGAGLLRRSDRWLRASSVATAVASLLVLGLGLRVGHAGGELVYAHNAGAAFGGASAAAGEAQTAASEAAGEEDGYDRDDDD